MSNDPSWDDIFRSQPGAAPQGSSSAAQQQPPAQQPTRRELRDAEARQQGGSNRPPSASYRGRDSEPPKRTKRRLAWLWVLLSLLLIGAVGSFAAWSMFEPQIRKVLGWELPIDYTTSGNGEEVLVVIKSGDIGADVAQTLFTAGVTMTKESFYKLLLATDPAPTFQPGTYALEKEMSAKSALARLQDPTSRVTSKVTIPEGKTLAQVLGLLAAGTGIDVAEFEAASTDLAALGVPETEISLEGYLFPATYTFDPGIPAQVVLQIMVNRMYQSLDAAGVAVEDRHRVLTLAALIQKEGGSSDDFYKVSRVFTNRINTGMLLQSDATVSYGSGGTSISTTGAERSDASNPYNTYVHPGLPVGPIAAPGDDAIDAALHPADGPWLYFVLINGETGETAFSTTLAEHNAAVKVWQAWLRAHPDFDN